MTRTELATAADMVEDAAVAADGEPAERLDDLAGQLDSLAEAERGPDHGRLARIQSGLHDVEPAVGDEAAACIRDALDEIDAYRETLEGV